ncbi:MAG: phosphatase PAP2 family protein [Myxococcaceae bacterium]
MPTLPLIPEEKKWKIILAGALFFLGSYFSCAVWGKYHATVIGFSFIDNQIPFLRWTIWFYISQYLIIPFSFAAVKKTENYSHMYYSMLTATLFSCVIFLLYPTAINRPETLDSSLIDTIRWVLYQLDSPTNCFPSLHVALACLSGVFVAREYKWLGIISWIWSGLIILSTMTLKQHYAIDVLGGIVTASFSYLLTLSLIKGSLESHQSRKIDTWPTGNLIAPQKHTKNIKQT